MRILSLIAAFLLLSVVTHAAKRYWIGTGANLNWNTTNNWSTSSGGASGASVPGSSDTAYFNSGGLGQCKLDVNISIKRLVMDTVYADTLKQNGKTITLGTGGASMKSGYFFCDNANMSTSGAFTIDGCVVKSTSATFTVTANFTLTSGTFTHNSGTVKFNSTSATITGKPTFYKLTFDAPTNTTYATTINSGDTITVLNNLTYSGTGIINLSTGVLNAQGDIYLSNTNLSGGPGSATIHINGTAKQTINGNATLGRSGIQKVKINKASDTLVLSSNVSVYNNWTYVQGIINAGTSTVYFANGCTISGDHTLYNVRFNAASETYVVSSGDTLTVTGTLLFSGSQYAILNTGTINAKGDITMAATWNGVGSGCIHICGTGNQTLTGTNVAYGGGLYNVNINKPSGTLYLKDLITCLRNWTYTQGTIDDSTYTGTVLFSNVPGSPLPHPTITGSHSLRRVVFYAPNGVLIYIKNGTSLTVTEELKFSGSNNTQIWEAGGHIHVKGDIKVLTTTDFLGGNFGNIYIDGTGDQHLYGTTHKSYPLCNVIIDKASGTLTMHDSLFAADNWTYIRGTVDPGSSTMTFGYATVDCQGTSSNMSLNNVVITRVYNYPTTMYLTTLAGKLTMNGSMRIKPSCELRTAGYQVDLAKDWSNGGTYTPSTSTINMNGSGNQWISKTSGTETFYKLILNKSGGKVYGLNPLDLTNNLTLTKGIYKSTSSTTIHLKDNVTLTGGSDSSYVHGPMKKTGNDVFTFALGDTTLGNYGYHPLSITAPSSTTDAYTTEYSATNGQALYGTTKVDSLEQVSTAEYWVLTRNAGSSTVTPKLGWNTNNGILGSQSTLTITGHNGTNWIDLGRTSMTLVGTTQGTLTATIGVNASSMALTFAKKNSTYTLLKRKLDGSYYQVTNNTLRFKYDEEYNDTDNLLNFRIYKTSDNSLAASDANVQNIFKKVYYGDNRYAFDVTLLNGGLASGDYVLEVTNEKSEKQYLRFKK